MNNTYQIYLISDSTGETLDRIFLAIKAQFQNIKYKIHTYSFTRTENQILKILSNAEKHKELTAQISPMTCLARIKEHEGKTMLAECLERKIVWLH